MIELADRNWWLNLKNVITSVCLVLLIKKAPNFRVKSWVKPSWITIQSCLVAVESMKDFIQTQGWKLADECLQLKTEVEEFWHQVSQVGLET